MRGVPVDDSALVGCRFGRLVVKRAVRKRGQLWWECQCDCGKRKFLARNEQIRIGRVLSCGCYTRSASTNFERSKTQLAKLTTARLKREIEKSLAKLAAMYAVLAERRR